MRVSSACRWGSASSSAMRRARSAWRSAKRITAPAETQVELPRPQPLDPDSLSTAPPAAAPPAAAPPPTTKPPQTTRRQAAPPPKPDPPPPAETARPPIQEIISANEQQQLRRSAQDHRSQALQLVAQAQRRSLSAAEQALVTRINQFVKSSSEAERNGELRSADDRPEEH